MYRAYLTRASSGDIDNTPVIDRILAARDEQAKLLGFSCFAEKSMASKARVAVYTLQTLYTPSSEVQLVDICNDFECINLLYGISIC